MKHYGKCALCGIETELTFEHIPPRKAFNWFGNKTISGDEVMNMIGNDRLPWERDGLRYNNQQRGTGEFCLCRQCNNTTGTLYGEEYIKFVTTVHYALRKTQPKPKENVYLKMQKLRPNPIIKQILSMFCSTNYRCYEDERIALLRQYVLEKNSSFSLKEKYKLSMYLFGGGYGKRIPITCQLLHTSDFSQYQTIVLSELAAYPVGYILYFDPPEDYTVSGADITSFSECKYEDIASIELSLPTYECLSIFPEDFRSQSELLECQQKNERYHDEDDLE